VEGKAHKANTWGNLFGSLDNKPAPVIAIELTPKDEPIAPKTEAMATPIIAKMAAVVILIICLESIGAALSCQAKFALEL